MIDYTTSKTDKELSDILDLQKMNLALNLSESEIRSQGFVTVSHSFEDIKKLNAYEQHIIIKDNEKLAGYLLAMTKHSRNDIPILFPLFELFDRLKYKQKLISAYDYIVVGQVCIHKEYRGMGLLDQCYAAYKNHFKEKYDFAITEIATSNTRSIRAHERIGFIEILKYTDQNNTEWSVVVWDWSFNTNEK